MTVFAVSGLWHGASLAFVFWGILNGIYQVIEDVAGEIRERPENYRKIAIVVRGAEGERTRIV